MQHARESQSAIAEQLSHKGELDRQAHQLERALEEQRANLSSEVDVLRERIRGLEAQLEAAAADDLEALRAELRALDALEVQRDAATKELQRMRERRSRLGAQKETLIAEGRALNDRLQRLDQADGAACPLCGQALTAEHRAEMMTQLAEERDQKRAQYRDCGAGMDDISAKSVKRQTEMDAWAGQLKHLPALQQRLGALAEGERQAEAAEAALPGERRQLSQLETRLTNEDFGVELRRQLQQVTQQREGIGYDAESHADIRAQLETLAAFERQHTLLEVARINLPEAQQIHDETASRLEAMRAAQNDDEEGLEQVRREIAALDEQARGSVNCARLSNASAPKRSS